MCSNRIAAIVLNWNRREDTLICLQSLCEQRDATIDLIAVDNGSTDGSAEAIRAKFPQATLVETGENLGYAGGNNQGLRMALQLGAEYVFLLNNDTVLAPDCVINLRQEMETHSDVAATAPKSFYFDHPTIIYFAGGKISFDGRTRHVGAGDQDGSKYQLARDADWLTGCAILFRSQVLHQIGLFDERYYLLFEDADWSLRARRAGYRLRCVPQAKLWHKVSLTFGRTESPAYLYYFTRNSFLWIEQNFSIYQRPFLYAFALKRSLDYATAWSIGLWAKERESLRQAVWDGFADYRWRKFGRRDF